jgi:hypothetical protein
VKLQSKLFITLMSGLVLVYLGSSLFQHRSDLSAIGGFSRQAKAKELDRHWRSVECVQQAIATSLEKIMARGDMDLFAQTIHGQASLPGLQEVSLTDHQGHIAYSTVPERLHQDLSDELKSQLCVAPTRLKRQTTNSFEIYQSLVADKLCVSCHTERHQGDVIGVISLRFSDEGLRTAQQSWDGLLADFSQRNAAIAATTTGLLLVIIGVLVSVCMHYLLVKPLKRTAAVMLDQAAEVSVATSQVSASSQSLAEGASEQAASLEETSSALEELSSMTKRNAANAQKVNDLAKQARLAADKGTADMQTMNAAMEAIKNSSADIAKIIKTIDEIAFQTNILALNAAVEAARAGEAGMGFAVVADEVRNLARRSAEAAKETAAKIEGAIGKTAQGVQISGQVAEALDEIAAKARQVDELAAEVAGASREQTQGITQINTAVGQMDTVTQSNAANAEESAAAAEELNAQAVAMKDSVAELLQLVGGQGQGKVTRMNSATPSSHAFRIAVPTAKRSAAVRGNGHGQPEPVRSGKAGGRSEIPMAGDFRDF